jgi:hypothetical protein
MVSILSDRWRFQLLPFDSRAAIEASELIAKIKASKDPWSTWAKVKFDIQIVAIAKAEGASAIYADDEDIERYAKRVNIPVIRICDLPLPAVEPEPESESEAIPVGKQQTLNLAPGEAPSVAPVEEGLPNEQTTASAGKNDERQADPAHSQPVQIGDSRRAQDEATTEKAEVFIEIPNRPCECGCGGFPKDPGSRFLPGHDLRKAYNDQKKPPQS